MEAAAFIHHPRVTSNRRVGDRRSGSIRPGAGCIISRPGDVVSRLCCFGFLLSPADRLCLGNVPAVRTPPKKNRRYALAPIALHFDYSRRCWSLFEKHHREQTGSHQPLSKRASEQQTPQTRGGGRQDSMIFPCLALIPPREECVVPHRRAE